MRTEKLNMAGHYSQPSINIRKLIAHPRQTLSSLCDIHHDRIVTSLGCVVCIYITTPAMKAVIIAVIAGLAAGVVAGVIDVHDAEWCCHTDPTKPFHGCYADCRVDYGVGLPLDADGRSAVLAAETDLTDATDGNSPRDKYEDDPLAQCFADCRALFGHERSPEAPAAREIAPEPRDVGDEAHPGVSEVIDGYPEAVIQDLAHGKKNHPIQWGKEAQLFLDLNRQYMEDLLIHSGWRFSKGRQAALDWDLKQELLGRIGLQMDEYSDKVLKMDLDMRIRPEKKDVRDRAIKYVRTLDFISRHPEYVDYGLAEERGDWKKALEIIERVH